MSAKGVGGGGGEGKRRVLTAETARARPARCNSPGFYISPALAWGNPRFKETDSTHQLGAARVCFRLSPAARVFSDGAKKKKRGKGAKAFCSN